jgi:CRISPR-associated endonuclease Csy4
MMNFYIDIVLKPDAQMPVNRFLNALYTQLHKVLFDLGSNNIGVSFPAHHVLLGNCLRIHGTQQALDRLQAQDWLARLADNCKVSEICEVPANIQAYRTVFRIQTTMSQSKLKRLLKRGSITEEEAKGYKAKLFTKGLDNAYVELESASNGHKHRRYIAFGALQSTPTAGVFDTFGLSKTATVPWFDSQP